MPASGGSDSHSIQGIGRSFTIFENNIPDRETLIAEIRAERFYPAEGLNIGKVQRFQNANS
jgi:hypothetical protein